MQKEKYSVFSLNVESRFKIVCVCVCMSVHACVGAYL